MKKIFLITLVAAFALCSCEDETSKGVSFVTSYPIIDVIGDQALTVPLNGTYADAGCTATEDEVDITSKVVTTGSVNTSKAGVYTITYTVANKDGYSKSSNRYVGVITPAAAAMDISGVYQRNAGEGGLATVTKTSYPGLYKNNNPGGIDLKTDSPDSPDLTINIYMFHTDAAVVSAPNQDSEVGPFACTGGVYDAVKGQYSWVCKNSGYGTAVRTFIKQ